MSLKGLALKGIRWNTFTTIFLAIGNLVQLYILVRFISKEDFGVMALLNAAITFARNFLDFGVGSGIIHKKEINDEQLSTLYWLSIIVGLALTILFFFISKPLAFFYENRELESLIKVISILFLINGIGGHYKILIIKGLLFNTLAKIKVVSFFISFIIVIFLAFKGCGVWALVVGTLANATLDSVLGIYFGKHFFKIQRIFELEHVQFYLTFGYFQMGERVLNFVKKQIDIILIGKFLGTEALGVYDLLKRLLNKPFQLINPIITNVSFPLMAKIHENTDMLSKIYLKQLNFVCSLNFPIYIFLFFNAEDIVQMMFGVDWIIYKSLFQILCCYFILYSTGNPVGSLLLAKGRADIGFYWNLGTVLLIPIGILIGIHGSLIGVAGALLILQFLLMIPNFLLQIKPLIFVGAKSYFSQILQPLFIAIFMGGLIWFMSPYFFESLTLRIFSLATFGGLIYLLLSLKFNRYFIKDIKFLIGL